MLINISTSFSFGCGLFGNVRVKDKATETVWLRWSDDTGAKHALSYDDPATLKAKYAACAKAGVRGVGITYADNVGYIGKDRADGLKMWGSLQGFRPVAPPPPPPSHVEAENKVDTAAPPPRNNGSIASPQTLNMDSRVAQRMWRRAGVASGVTIPGFDPCKHPKPRPAPPGPPAPPHCAIGMLCISPTIDGGGVAQHESGECCTMGSTSINSTHRACLVGRTTPTSY